MTDIPQQIKDLQLKIWPAKSPMERLHQFMKDNEALINFWNNVKPVSEENNQPNNLTIKQSN